MRRSRELIIESAAVASILIVISLGGSITTSLSQPAFSRLSDPGLVTKQYDLTSLALYYNLTLSAIGTGKFDNASFLLDTFRFVNVSPKVNQTAQVANADLASVDSTVPRATLNLGLAQEALNEKEYLNATTLVDTGCAQAREANQGLSDFQRPQTSHFQSLSVPTSLYSVGASLAVAEVQGELADCHTLLAALPSSDAVFAISSPQKTVETGGPVVLDGTLTLRGAGAGGQEALFYINGSYFGSLITSAAGNLSGTLTIPFVYKPLAVVQAVVAPNATLGVGGAFSNLLNFTLKFNQTSIVMGDPPSYLPGEDFRTFGNLTTTSGIPLPSAPVRITFLGESRTAITDSRGEFFASLSVPANATDGTYYVNATFAPEGALGPSFNFTSVRVVHIPLSLTVSAPFSFAGFPTQLTGSALANGTSVSGARILVDTPWGSYKTVTNGTGQFKLNLAVSILDFAFAGHVKAMALPTQPYLASGSASATVRFFNVLVLVFPAVAIVTVTYEADKMGVFERPRKTANGAAVSEEARPTEVEKTHPAGTAETPDVVALYNRALELASSKLGLRFGEGKTIREVLESVSAARPTEGFEEFSRILLAAEDFLYAPSFDSSRLQSARGDMSSLEGRWA